MKNIVRINAIDWRLLFLFSIFALYGFGLLIYPSKLYIFKFLWLIWPISILSFILYNKKQIYGKYILLMNIFLFINAIGCYINRGQSLISFYEGWEFCTLSSINIYFIVYILKNDIEDFEKLLYYLSILLCLIYILQYYIYPIPIVIGAQHMIDRGSIETGARFRIIGQAFAFLSFFMGQTKFYVNHQIKYLIQLLLGGTVLIMLGFRNHLFIVPIFTIITYYKIFRFSFKKLLLFLIYVIFVCYFFSHFSFVKRTIELIIERENSEISNDTRWYTIHYFQTSFFRNTWEMILGAGLPGLSGHYTFFIDQLKEKMIIFADIGFWGLSWMAGIPTVLMIIIYPIIAFFKKVPKEYSYIGITLLCILFSSVFTREIFREGNPYIFGIMLALQEKIIKNENRNTNISLLSQLWGNASGIRLKRVSNQKGK